MRMKYCYAEPKKTNLRELAPWVAAITAGLTSGILENTVANTLSPAETKTALSYMVGNTVETLLDTAYNDVRIIGATPGTQVLAGSNKGKDFRRSDGTAGGSYASGAPRW